MSVVQFPVRSPVQSPVQGNFGGGSVSQTFDQLIASLLSAGETVAFYDPDDLTSIYAARTGGANAVADGPVGLMLDKAQMGGLTAAEYLAALDTPELFTSTSAGDWTRGFNSVDGTFTYSDGAFTYTMGASDTSGARFSIPITGLVVGKFYVINVSITGTGPNLFGVSPSTSGTGSIAFASYTSTPLIFKAAGSTLYFWFSITGTTGDTAIASDISFKELPGYHATAPSDAARPILRDVSSTYALDFDNVDDAFAWTTPAITDGTWVALTRDGSYAASAAYSAGTYTMPIYQPFDLCAILWTSADLTTVQEAIVLAEGSARGAAADFGGVTSFQNGWRARADLRDFPVIDTGSGTSFQDAWRQCANLTSFPLIDVSSGTNFGATWFQCTGLTSFPLIDVSSGTNFVAAWATCTSLTSFPLLDVSSGTNFSFAWYQCSSLTSFPLLDVSSGTNFRDAWQNCTSLTTFPLLNVSNGTNFLGAWYNCNKLTSFPLLDVSSGTDFSFAWYNCNSLTSFPLLDVSSGTNFQSAWQNCTSLANFPANMFDSVTATNFANAFTLTNLTQTSIDNILTSINTAGTSGGTFNQSGGSAPSATGEAAIDALRGRGWTVTVTGGY